ncbi:MAG: ShlB/FhaC/HecB family hemolysin secretion/activation protein, partial [Rhodocyclaceae bacterium]|nr:ShlB/FhaC/HecB family hemolysin secretion/activation protein [Rhodocyclaceae bacterium]
LYARRGFRTVKVILPEQQTASGEFRIKVIEARIGSVIVNGNQHFSDRQILAAVPALQEGESPDMLRVTRQVQVANENPARQMAVILKESRGDALVDAVVQVADQTPLRAIAYLDNTGSTQTGRFRLGGALQHANLFGREHVLTLQAATSPGHVKDVSILGLGYRIPFYSVESTLDLSASYSDVDSGRVAGVGGGPDLNISGSGSTFGATFTRQLAAPGDWRQKLGLGLEYKFFRNQVLAGSTSLIPNLASRPLSLIYSLARREPAGGVNLRLALSHNLPGGTDNNTAAYQQAGARSEATANFLVLRWHAGMDRTFANDWTLSGNASGQWTRDALIPGEQFGIGGAQSVRGFDERVLANDQGLRTSVELTAPNIANRLDLQDFALRPGVFWDFGHVWRNHALPGEIEHSSIASVGASIRATFGSRASFSADYGIVTVPGAGRQRGDARLHASFVLQF